MSHRKVSLLVEIPETLYESLQNHIDTHPQWDQERAFTSALSLWLMQNGGGDRAAGRVYLDTLFDFAA